MTGGVCPVGMSVEAKAATHASVQLGVAPASPPLCCWTFCLSSMMVL